MPFVTPLLVKSDSENSLWILTHPLVYLGARDRFVVPTSFDTDLASVPRLLWPVFPPHGRYNEEAVLHDFLYAAQLTSRKDADGIFRRTMREKGVSWWRRRVMWLGVRAGGWVAWRKSAKNRERVEHWRRLSREEEAHINIRQRG